MAQNYSSRTTYTDQLNNLIKPLLHNNVNLFNIDISKQSINVAQYVQTLNSQLTTFPTSETTTIKINSTIKSSVGALYKQWKCQPFAFVFDWFPGLVMVNGWPIEIIMQMSIYHEFQQMEGILPFCQNISELDKLYWDGCKDYSHIDTSSWQINKTSLSYPANWLGLYFEENKGLTHNYEGKNHLAYWIEKWNDGYIPKICVYGLFDCNGIPIFNSKSATDDIYLTISNSDLPRFLENVHIDAYSFGENCQAIIKDFKIIVTEEVTETIIEEDVLPINVIGGSILPETSWPNGQMDSTATSHTTITMPTTINYQVGVLPLPFPGEKFIKINPNSGASWISFDKGVTWYVGELNTSSLSGPFPEPYWGSFVKIDTDPDNPYWVNPSL